VTTGLRPGRSAPAKSAPSARAASALLMSDYLRRSPARLGGDGGYKEWHHFIVHDGDLHLLVNLSLVDDPWQPDRRRAERARLIVLAQARGWSGAVDTFAAEEVEVADSGHTLRFPRGECRFTGGRYHVRFATADGRVAAELELDPISEPALANNQSLSAGKTLRWLFVPRLTCRGRARVNGDRFSIAAAPAYHDHNWGMFQWGDDFSWEWASALPRDPACDWSVVFMRMGNRGRTLTRCQGLYLWRGATPARIFRDAELTVRPAGLADVPAPMKLPPVMSLLAPKGVKDVPARLEVEARGEGDVVKLMFETEDVAQIIVPNEVDATGVTILNEVAGRVVAHGRVRGSKLDFEGSGVFELLSH
jgi:hypothetical protein